jgi:very-short-patch-repair endonuclease
MKCKIYNRNEINELSQTYDLKLPKPTLKQLNKKVKTAATKPKKLTRIQRNAKELNDNLPASERWFQSLWPYRDLYNQVLGKFIPDVLNRTYRYVIEVDGSIHLTSKQKRRDRRKDNYYKSKGYKVFRVKAYDIVSYDKCLTDINKLRLR